MCTVQTLDDMGTILVLIKCAFERGNFNGMKTNDTPHECNYAQQCLTYGD